jgi:hypothetical protein
MKENNLVGCSKRSTRISLFFFVQITANAIISNKSLAREYTDGGFHASSPNAALVSRAARLIYNRMEEG